MLRLKSKRKSVAVPTSCTNDAAGQRATLIRSPDARTYGLLMELTHAEIEQLYSEASVRTYRPEAVLAELTDGSQVPASCFNLLVPPSPEETKFTGSSLGLARAGTLRSGGIALASACHDSPMHRELLCHASGPQRIFQRKGVGNGQGHRTARRYPIGIHVCA